MLGAFALGRWLVSLALMFGLAACATQSHQTIGTLLRASASTGEHRILLLPTDIQLGELSAGGLFVPRADWTDQARANMRTALAQELNEIRGRLIRVEDIDGAYDRDEKQVQIMKLNEAVGKSILIHQYAGPFQLPTKRDGFSWTLGSGVRYLKDKYKADYALFIFMRDSYATSGRVAFIVIGALLGVAVPGGRQLGFASLVDLETGEVVWFNRLARGSGDLRTGEVAVESTKTLLTSFPR